MSGVVAGTTRALTPHPLDQAIEEPLALSHLVESDQFIRLVCLLDRAGAANDGRDAGLLEQTAFRGEAHLAGAIGTGEREGELHDLVAIFRR